MVFCLPSSLAFFFVTSRRRVSYTFTRDGILSRTGTVVLLWSDVEWMSLRRVSSTMSRSVATSILVFNGQGPAGPRSVPFIISDLGFEATRSMVHELLARLPLDKVDPAMLVLRSWLMSIAESTARGSSALGATSQETRIAAV